MREDAVLSRRAGELSCAVCGRALYHAPALIDDRGRFYCRACSRDTLPCFGCGAPVHTGVAPTTYVLCTACRAVAISDVTRIRQVFRETRTMLARRLKLRVPGDIVLKVLDATAVQHADQQAAIAGQRILGLFVLRGDSRTILIRCGLPLIVLRATLAHELAHAWQSVHCQLPLTTARAEGHAEWVAYHALQALGARLAAERLRAAHLPYARELAAFLQLEAQVGSDGVQRLMVTHDARPLA